MGIFEDSMSCLFPLSRQSPFFRDSICKKPVGMLYIPGFSNIRPERGQKLLALQGSADLPQEAGAPAERSVAILRIDPGRHDGPQIGQEPRSVFEIETQPIMKASPSRAARSVLNPHRARFNGIGPLKGCPEGVP